MSPLLTHPPLFIADTSSVPVEDVGTALSVSTGGTETPSSSSF